MRSTSPEELVTTNVKENIGGASSKKRRQKRIFLWGIGIILFYVTIIMIYNSHFAGMFVPDVAVDREETGRGRDRRREGRQKKRLQPELATYVLYYDIFNIIETTRID
jgi:hypothetical protein